MTLGHASLDIGNRLIKAEEVLSRLTELKSLDSGVNLLDYGSGAGLFSYVVKCKYKSWNLYSADIEDQRLSDYKVYSSFIAIDSISHKIEAPNNFFDVIVCQMVFEHIDPKFREHYLRELFSKLKQGGLIYFAVPNKYALVEPHFHLVFLSWFTQEFANRYIRLFKKGSDYDCFPMTRKQMEILFESIDGLNFSDITSEVIYNKFPITKFLNFSKFLSRIVIVPSYIYALTKL